MKIMITKLVAVIAISFTAVFTAKAQIKVGDTKDGGKVVVLAVPATPGLIVALTDLPNI
jgi:hypothetical protein